ncbi:hypothetical protein M8C21_028092, partial [Ambrosia artemisiifolia]
MSEEKHGPATRKRKLKKTDIALNKNEGKKRQKVSHNGPSTSKQPTQTAKQKSSKGKDARATRVKETKKGDACSGDVVLFKQNMYNSQRNLIGRRTVAGRIVKESYGASTKHTFLVEVLWSKRYQKLDPLSILPVTGRNLYQFGTFRQPWKSEAERSTVLEEKHERGKAARLKWKLREKDFVFGDNKGKKLHKVSHRVSSHSKHKFVNKNTTAHNQAVLFQNPDLKRSTQPTYHSDPNCSMSSDHHLQEASLPFSYDRNPQFNCLPTCSSSGHSHHNNEQQAPDQGLSQPSDHHHHDSEQGGPDQGLSQPPDHHHHNSESPVH